MAPSPGKLDEALRRVVARVAVLNLTYFGVEFGVALAIGSVSLFADSIDFLEDTSVNFLILIALGWGARRRTCWYGARWHPARSWLRDALDRLGQVLASHSTGIASTFTCRGRSDGSEPYLCIDARALSHPWG